MTVTAVMASGTTPTSMENERSAGRWPRSCGTSSHCLSSSLGMDPSPRRLLILDLDRTVRVAACDLERLYEWIKRGEATDDMEWGDPSQHVLIPEAAARIIAAAEDSVV